MVEVVANEPKPLQLLLSLGLLESFAPVGGSELEDTAIGPGREEDEEVSEIGEGLDAVHPTGGQEGDDDSIPLGTAVGGAEEPVLLAHLLVTEGQLRGVVVEAEGAVVEKLISDASSPASASSGSSTMAGPHQRAPPLSAPR